MAPSIKLETEFIKNNLDDLTQYLFVTYGNLPTVIKSILREVESARRPEIYEYREKNNFMKKFANSLQKLYDLKRVPEIPSTEWESTVFGIELMDRLMRMMIYEDQVSFRKKLSSAGMNARTVYGQTSFNFLLQYVMTEVDATSDAPETPGSKKARETNSKRSAHAVDSTPSHEASQEHISIPANANAASTTPLYETPCGLKFHKHDLAACPDFWNMTPTRRKNLTEGRTCWTCLGARHKCKVSSTNQGASKCKNTEKVHKTLICSKCKEFIEEGEKDFSPCNIIMCTYKAHISSFPPINKKAATTSRYLKVTTAST